MKRLLSSMVLGLALVAGVGCQSESTKSGTCGCSHSGASACTCSHCGGSSTTCNCPKK